MKEYSLDDRLVAVIENLEKWARDPGTFNPSHALDGADWLDTIRHRVFDNLSIAPAGEEE